MHWIHGVRDAPLEPREVTGPGQQPHAQTARTAPIRTQLCSGEPRVRHVHDTRLSGAPRGRRRSHDDAGQTALPRCQQCTVRRFFSRRARGDTPNRRRRLRRQHRQIQLGPGAPRPACSPDVPLREGTCARQHLEQHGSEGPKYPRACRRFLPFGLLGRSRPPLQK